MGVGLTCVIVHRGGAAHAQYRLCARITERLPKIRKIFTRITEDGLGALTIDMQPMEYSIFQGRLLEIGGEPHRPEEFRLECFYKLALDNQPEK